MNDASYFLRIVGTFLKVNKESKLLLTGNNDIGTGCKHSQALLTDVSYLTQFTVVRFDYILNISIKSSFYSAED